MSHWSERKVVGGDGGRARPEPPALATSSWRQALCVFTSRERDLYA